MEGKSSCQFREPSEHEKGSGADLIGARISIYWDGDDVYYPGKIQGFDSSRGTHSVVYEGDNSEEVYNEDLRTSAWQIWTDVKTNEIWKPDINLDSNKEQGSTEDKAEESVNVSQAKTENSTCSTRKKIDYDPKMSYSAMVVEAVYRLGDKNGSSLPAIRKFIQTNFNLRKQQTASFNSLTLKAINKAVATNELERCKNTFKLTNQEREKRKERERKLLGGDLGLRNSVFDKERDPDVDNMLQGTAFESNAALRKLWETMKEQRDNFLSKNMDCINPFLSEKNYFWKKDMKKIRESAIARYVGGNHLGSALSQQVNIPSLPVHSNPQIQVPSHLNAAQQFVMQNNWGMLGHQSSLLQLQQQAQGLRPPSGMQNMPTNLQYFPHSNVHGLLPQNLQSIQNMQMYQNYNNNLQNIAFAYSNLQSVNKGMSTASLPNGSNLGHFGGSTLGLNIANSNNISSAVSSGNPAVYSYAANISGLAMNNYNIPPNAMIGTNPILPSTGANQSKITDDKSFEVGKVTESLEGKEIAKSESNKSVDPVDFDLGRKSFVNLDNIERVRIPSILQATLHEHQLDGISWMVSMFKRGMPMILGDQMGLGKTLQSIGYLACLHSNLNRPGPYLIVAPLSVLSNWLSEIERFCPSLRAVRFHGPKDERTRLKVEELSSRDDFDIVVTTFEMLVAEINYFRRKFVWTAVIVDEGHRLKNEKSQLSEKLRTLPTLSKVILTGTPLQNNLRELWALLHYLCPDIFTAQTAEKFQDGFDLLRNKIDTNILRSARKLLSIFMLRRVKDEVNIPLPSRKEITLLVPLAEDQVTWYRHLIGGMDRDIMEMVMRTAPNVTSSSDSTDVVGSSENIPHGAEEESQVVVRSSTSSSDPEWRRLMNLLLQLRKVCNHTYLMPDSMPESYEISEDLVKGSGKLQLLDRMLPKLREKGHRVLLFSQFTSMLDLLEDYCELRSHSYVRLDGNTNRVQRRLDVRRFNADNSNIFIFLISTRAGGLGLNLASADTVILYDSDWNPQVDIQAMERAHRIGQTKPVRVYRLVCRGSVEERMVTRAGKKMFLNAMVAENHTKKNQSKSSTEDDNKEGELDEDCEGGFEVGDNDISHALGIGSANISKDELASLIRFGANAVVESSCQEQLSDVDLDVLLEMQGRDVPIAESVSKVEEELAETIAKRSEKLQEVDLRQLGDVIFVKKKTRTRDSFEENHILDSDEPTKRARKERIVMVNGMNSGYGSSLVPILAETIPEAAENTTETTSFKRGRQWTHQSFCCLCGFSKEPEDMSRCGHCPKVFHNKCLKRVNLPRGSGIFLCPHHRCVGCARSTAASGGLLFRCLGCLTAFCEDCLPQDDIESVGRCRDLESQGYFSKQSYYIRCQDCIPKAEEISRPAEISECEKCVDTKLDCMDSEGTREKERLDEGEVEEEGDGDGDGEGILYATQLIKIFSKEKEEIKVEKTDKKKKNKKSTKKASRCSTSNRRGNTKSKSTEEIENDISEGEDDVNASAENDEDQSEADSDAGSGLEDIGGSITLPERLDYQETMDLMLSTPFLSSNEMMNDLDQYSQLVTNIVNKIEKGNDLNNLFISVLYVFLDYSFSFIHTKGRYRSTQNFASDVRGIFQTCNMAFTKLLRSHYRLVEKGESSREDKQYARDLKKQIALLEQGLIFFNDLVIPLIH